MSDLESKLIRLIDILHEAKEEHWVQYFLTVIDLLHEGKVSKAKKTIRGACGGMGSFNDTSLNFINEVQHAEALRLSREIYNDS